MYSLQVILTWNIILYAANLTNFLIKERSGGIDVENLRDAINKGLTFCVWRGASWDDYLKGLNAKRVPKESGEEVIEGTLKWLFIHVDTSS